MCKLSPGTTNIIGAALLAPGFITALYFDH